MKSKRIEKLESGFLSPTGEFFPCSYMAHITVADELLETLCPDKYFDDPEEQLRKLGWVDIHMEITSRNTMSVGITMDTCPLSRLGF